MGQPLRITFNNADHIFQITDHSPITKSTTEIQILLDGKTVTVVRGDGNTWTLKENDSTIDPGLIQAIGKAISLRYRI